MSDKDLGLVRGQKIIAIGSPLGLFNTISDGIVSGFREFDYIKMVQITAPISPGSSGGALINMHGKLVGITTAGLDGQNLNMAVPDQYIKEFVGNVLKLK
ncbi:S1C family serine protease [Anaeromicrobium sediminis]|uniref:S1C family serine protease n=1 Tax=Anaeromicrobium sediminis TaxID=1478221 RepID=UPI001FA8D481|nr:S1C family serine protease [Anaeromicrobium sediminis]